MYGEQMARHGIHSRNTVQIRSGVRLASAAHTVLVNRIEIIGVLLVFLQI